MLPAVIGGEIQVSALPRRHGFSYPALGKKSESEKKGTKDRQGEGKDVDKRRSEKEEAKKKKRGEGRGRERKGEEGRGRERGRSRDGERERGGLHALVSSPLLEFLPLLLDP